MGGDGEVVYLGLLCEEWLQTDSTHLLLHELWFQPEENRPNTLNTHKNNTSGVLKCIHIISHARTHSEVLCLRGKKHLNVLCRFTDTIPLQKKHLSEHKICDSKWDALWSWAWTCFKNWPRLQACGDLSCRNAKRRLFGIFNNRSIMHIVGNSPSGISPWDVYL